MTSRERLATTLDHRQPDRVCVDFGATFVTGLHVCALDRLRKAVLGDDGYRVKVIEPYQMLGEVDDELREALGIDVIGLLPRKSIFGTPDEVYAEVRERIDIFNKDGGMVFNSIHNIQTDTPTENMLAMFKAIRDSSQ